MTRTATLLAIVSATALLACSTASRTLDGPAAAVRDLTGAHTRIVWVQGDGTDPFAAGEHLILMGFDTDDGRGERVILGTRRSYVKPLLTPRGNRIVFSSRPDPGPPEIFVVAWDGSGVRRLAPGFALAVWQDPATGREWVYAGRDHRKYDFATVVRFPLDDPNQQELVWNKTPVSGDTFQVSPDGRLAGGLFPWPEAGVAELPNRGWRRLGEGCWTALADVGRPLFWYFDGAHRNLTVVELPTERRWVVNINGAPGFRNAEVYHPRWTNHPRFLAITGPYNRGGDNQVRSGGAQTEVHLGRFSADFSRVERWVRVTYNDGGDSYPDVWIDRARSPHPMRAAGPLGPAVDARAGGAPAGGSAPGSAVGRLVVEATLVRATPAPSPQAIAPYRHALVVHLYEVTAVVEGTYPERTLLVAEWAVRDGRVLPTSRTVGRVYRLTVERYDAHPELEGERLVMVDDLPDLPLFYDVGTR
jgi:hypothetical protein